MHCAGHGWPRHAAGLAGTLHRYLITGSHLPQFTTQAIQPDERWLDRDAGPVARPYTLTGGRTRPKGQTHFDLIDVVVTTDSQSADTVAAGPEHRQILYLCRRPVAVADLASEIGVSLGVIRVLLGDLAYEGKIKVLQASRGPVTDERILRQVLDGLHAL